MIKEHPLWHTLPSEDVASALSTSITDGLSHEEARQRLDREGPNELPKTRAEHPFKRFIRQLRAPLVYVLLFAGGLTIYFGGLADASVILGVVLLNAVIGFIQEGKAIASLASLASSVQGVATVIRDGTRHRIAMRELVPGDLVSLESGDRVPADIRLVWVKDAAVAEASLTGESVPVEKSESVLDERTVLADRSNMTYASTIVTRGSARGIVVATGTRTELGTISSLLSETTELATPLTKQIEKVSVMLLWAILALAVVTFVVGILRGGEAVEMLLAAVALSVGAIPEGLPAAVTIILAIGVNRMAKRRAIIRRLPAVETLGSTTVICSDKTGTLTENQMTVVNVSTLDAEYNVTGTGYHHHGDIHRHLPGGEEVQVTHVGRDVALHETIRAGVLCSTATIKEDKGQWVAVGDPTEAALVVLATKASITRDVENELMPLVDMLPFSSENQYMATLHRHNDGVRIYMKGSVESVALRCDHMLGPDGERVPIDRARIHRAAESMSSHGWRVLACALSDNETQHHSITHEDVERGFLFCGLVAMIDPPREEARMAISECQRAGIKVKMITGDHASTASAIARDLGLKGREESGRLVSFTGSQLATMTSEEFDDAAEHVAVFARVSPEQKLRLVESMQRSGHVVAMTGDGVNDAPALKAANIGVAMGQSGTDVAKEASSMVLTDDNFATIVAAVEEGRTVYDNLLKFIVWTIPTNLGEGLVIVAAVAMGTELPILPVQILWINMTTAVILGLPLAFESIAPDTMSRPPRDPKAPLFSRNLVMRTFFVGAMLLLASFGVFLWEVNTGHSLPLARTSATNAFVVMQMFYLFNCRTLSMSKPTSIFSNMYLWYGAGTMLVLQLAFTYVPFFNVAFHSAPVGLTSWTTIAVQEDPVVLLVEFEKYLRRRHHARGTSMTTK
ncbi:MAG: HAD-IC family P-type ATPase [Ignavibacteria bacterium]|nr:HAD-IC family P-type ATPase [Ignavibacteria bacterium]